jgi:uncharacterized membrane protein
MQQFVAAYVLAAIAFAIVDFGWLTLATDRLYRPALGTLLRDPILLPPAVLFYLVITLGMTVLAILPGVAAGSVTRAFGLGLVLGLTAYGTYNLTNLSTLRDWPILVTVVDLTWGTLLTGLSSALATYVMLLIFGAARA